MIATIHKGLTSEKWNGQPMEKRILNIVSELTRAKSLMGEKREDLLKSSLERVLELMDLTTDSWKEERSFLWLKEFLRLREMVACLYLQENSSETLPEMINVINAFLDMEPACHNLGLQI